MEYPSKLIKPINKISDMRGWVYEILKFDSKENNIGQIFLTAAYPGKTKGNHYHTRKREWFCVVSGKGEMKLVNVKECPADTAAGNPKKSSTTVTLDAENPSIIEVQPYWAHSLTSVSSEPLLAVVIADEVFNPDDADTYEYFVI